MTESSERSPIRGAAFDLDGLLVNTEELYQHVGTELLARRGHTFEPELLDRMMGRPQQVSLQIMIDWHGLTDTIETLAGETREIFVDLLDTRLAPMPGAALLLEQMVQRGLPRGVATSSGPDFAHDVLSRVGLRDRFGFVLTSADVTHGKPHPDVFLKAAAKTGVPPARCVVFEDALPGIEAGHAGGMKVVGVATTHPETELTGKVHRVVHRLDELTVADLRALVFG
jgi:HAD superfamily hydrolase (TIGR01509 family)